MQLLIEGIKSKLWTEAATETLQVPAFLQALATYLPLTRVAEELESGAASLLDRFCHPKFNSAPVTLTSHNYLNELLSTEACGGAIASPLQDSICCAADWACGAPVSAPKWYWPP